MIRAPFGGPFSLGAAMTFWDVFGGWAVLAAVLGALWIVFRG